MPNDGILTLLMTDLEGSTASWERAPQAMREAMVRHDEIAGAVVAEFGGRLVKPRGEGDSLFVVFDDPVNAVLAAEGIQSRFAIEEWPSNLRLRTRIGIHSGDVHAVDRDIYGPTVNRTARLRGIGHGGQTLVSKATQLLIASRMPAGLRLRDLGTHRLRDLQEPERVYQLEAEEPRSFPPLRSLDARPNNLPLQLTSFLGREGDIAAVQQALEISRLVTLVGPGGSGKTRLAIQVAAEHRDPFPDGIWFAELAVYDTEEEIAAAIATAVGGDPRNADPLSALDGIPEALLVLDNAEHAVVEVAKVVARALKRVSKLRVLTTSREPLRVAGEALVRVDPFDLPALDAPPEIAAQYASVRLFVERAASRLDGFRLTDENGKDVVRICRRLDGIPLAIEQAASIVPYLSPGEIAGRLEETFDLLESDEAGVVPRHRTLEATIDWSHSLLSPDEQLLFRRLAVFAGTFTIGSVEEVCADDRLDRRKVLRLLRALADKSLVVRNPVKDNAEVRHRLLMAVAEYASLRLGVEAADFERRLFDWARGLVEEASQNPYGSGEPSWSQRLEEDHPNLRRAIEIGLRNRWPEVVDLVFSLRHFWLSRGHLAIAKSFLERVLNEGTGIEDTRRAQLLNALGAFAWRGNDLEAARRHYEASLAIQNRANDAGGAASVLNNLAILAGDLGRHDEAIRLYDQALALVEAGDYPTIIRLTRVNLAMSLLDLNRLEEAESEMRLALLLSQESSDRARIALLKASLSEIALRRADHRVAANLLREAFTIWQDQVDLFVMAGALVDVAKLALEAGDLESAQFCVRAFLGVMRTTETRPKARSQAKLDSVLLHLASGEALTPLSTDAGLPQEILTVISRVETKLPEPRRLTRA
jgi:predicted ATPase/class 3 adenylate cyclase